MPGIHNNIAEYLHLLIRSFAKLSTEDAHVIFRDAGNYNMTESGHAWFVTEQALSANNTPDGVLGLQLEHANSDNRHIRVRLTSFTVKMISAL